jgi:hypothetical protein
MAENLHEYKLYRKQLGLLPEGDYQGRPLAHTKEAPGMRDGSASRKLWRKSWVFQHSINKLEPKISPNRSAACRSVFKLRDSGLTALRWLRQYRLRVDRKRAGPNARTYRSQQSPR